MSGDTAPLPVEREWDMFDPACHAQSRFVVDYFGTEPSAADRVMADRARSREQERQAALEREALETARAAEREEARVRLTERYAAEEQEKAERAERERVEWERRMAEIEAESSVAAAARDAFSAAIEKRDDDFHAFQVSLLFKIDGATLDGESLEEDYDPAVWGLDEDENTNRRKTADLHAAVTAAIEPWVSHYRRLGLIRADFANFEAGGEPCDAFTGPRFFLVHHADDVDLSAETLAEFTPVKIDLPTPVGATLTLRAATAPINATMLHDAILRGGAGVGQWGGEATPVLAPAPGEGRDEWLERVSLPRAFLGRLVERWVVCGRRPDMFRAFGDADERETGSKPTDWLVDGVLARGVLTVLAGDGSAGKTSLVHEWLSSLGGTDLARPRTVLGRVVTGRSVCAVIYGEGAAGMDSHRTRCHAKVWGMSAYAEFKGTRESLPNILAGLRGFPSLDFLAIDPMRPFLKGDEKSSDVINEFYMPLERFAEDMNCAVVITQHVSKSGLNGKSAHDAKSAILGATTVINRPRMVIAMDRRGSTIRLTPVKHNFAEEMLWVRSTEWSVWKHDPETHTLVPTEKIATGATGAVVDLDPIFDAIAGQNSLGSVLRRTGRHELFERKLPQLAGISRQAMRAGVAALIEAGRLRDGQNGLVALDDEASAPGAS